MDHDWNKLQVSNMLSRQKLNSNWENIVLYFINLDVFSIAIEFLTTNDLDSGVLFIFKK